MKLFMVSHLFCSKPCNVVHLKMLCWGNRRFCSKYHASTFSVVRVARKFLSQSIDLSADTAAILNLLDLRSIMGCPGGTRSVFPRFTAFYHPQTKCKKSGCWRLREVFLSFSLMSPLSLLKLLINERCASFPSPLALPLVTFRPQE